MVELVPLRLCCSWRGCLSLDRQRMGWTPWGCVAGVKTVVDPGVAEPLKRLVQEGEGAPVTLVPEVVPPCYLCCRHRRLICPSMPGCLPVASPGRQEGSQGLGC